VSLNTAGCLDSDATDEASAARSQEHGTNGGAVRGIANDAAKIGGRE
jgi:hypothetical protein